MNNSWEFGWEAISAVFGVLAVVVVVVVEWDKLVERRAFPKLLFFGAMVAIGAGIGFAISQALLWWRIAALVFTALIGAFFGALLHDNETPSSFVVVNSFGVAIGIIIGLWLIT
jgi:hypothetical protein